VTNLVDGLERAGYVQRASHPTDGRTTLATITPAGRAVARDATEALHQIRFGTEPLSDEALTAMTEILREARAGAGDFGAAR
jgi:DNA-binding MarR family transcriptional regulator